MNRTPVLVCDLKRGLKRHTSGALAGRIWIENKHLIQAGFRPGRHFDVTIDADTRTVVLRATDEGRLMVSRREKNGEVTPIIDLCRVELAEALPGERLRVEVYDHLIRVRVHPAEAARKARFESLMAALRSGAPLTIGDVAHGGGILSDALMTGLADQGVTTELRFAIEIDEPTLLASIRNNPRWGATTTAFRCDMQEVDLNHLPQVHGLIAGLPCVGASRSGKAKNAIRHPEEHPEAGALFVRFLQIIEATNPAFILLENVPDYQNSVSMVVIRQVLRRLGYQVHETILDNRLGAFEQRRRMCMIAVTEGVSFSFEGLAPSKPRERTLGEMLDPLPDDDPRWKPFDYLFRKEQRDQAAGKGFRMQIRGPEDTEIGTIGAGYAKVRSTEPLIRHPREKGLYRLLTPREHARVKSVPERLVEGLNDTLAHHILGNGVLHAAFVSVGRLLARCLRSGLVAHSLPDDCPPELPASAGPADTADPPAKRRAESDDLQIALAF